MVANATEVSEGTEEEADDAELPETTEEEADDAELSETTEEAVAIDEGKAIAVAIPRSIHCKSLETFMIRVNVLKVVDCRKRIWQTLCVMEDRL